MIRVYLNLPWELRHHINTLCVQGSYDNEVVVRQKGKDQLSLLMRQPVDTHIYRWAEDPIFVQFSPERVGQAASREMLETYYGTRTFKFVHEELGCVAAFIEKCSCDLALNPTALLRRLHLQIQPFRYAQLRETELMRNEQEICCQALESLAALRHPRAAIGVHVDLAQGVSDEEEFEELLEYAAIFMFRVVEVVERLKMRGLNIKVTLESRWNEKYGVELDSTLTTSFDGCVTMIKNSYRYTCSQICLTVDLSLAIDVYDQRTCSRTRSLCRYSSNHQAGICDTCSTRDRAFDGHHV